MAIFDGHNIICLDCEVLHSPNDLPTGWGDYAALGLSIGGYWDGLDGRVHWFDQQSLRNAMVMLVNRQPLIISFNGLGFDGPLMAAVLSATTTQEVAGWQDLWTRSYDILAEVWRVTGRDYAWGNSLDALCQTNGLGRKTGHGTHAPKLWQRGRIAEVLNYCQQDILLTLALAEHLTQGGGHLARQAGAIRISYLEHEGPVTLNRGAAQAWAIVEPRPS